MVIRGYLGLPTVVDNVETLAHLTEIAIEGGASFAKRGTRASTGTKLISISGDVEQPGLYEYEFGVTLSRVLQDCGAKTPIAVQVSGPSGVLVTPDDSPAASPSRTSDRRRLHGVRPRPRHVRGRAQLRAFLRA